MKYCKLCVQPDTRPGIELDASGVCNACIGHEEKTAVINWAERKEQFENLIKSCQERKDGPYDCLIPVSGGKDSTYQLHVMKNIYKLNPLCVTIRTPARTELGQRNLDNLIRIGVDHIDFSINTEVERKFIYKALEKTGIVSLPFHMALFSIPLRFAAKFKIPLIVWGESTQMEYGGSASDRKNPYMDAEWVKKYGCSDGMLGEDWIDQDLSENELYPYCFPDGEELEKAKIQSVFLGYYFKWDPVKNMETARNLGFQHREEGPALGLYDFSDVDCDFIVIHHYIKWLKFGMTRLFDNISVEIRNGRMTREEGIQRIRQNEVAPPKKQISMYCDFLKIPETQFWEILETFRNHVIWKKDDKGNWYLPDFLKGM